MKPENRAGLYPVSMVIESPAPPASPNISCSLIAFSGMRGGGGWGAALKPLIMFILTAALLWGAAYAPVRAEENSLPGFETGKVQLSWSELKGLLEELDELKEARDMDEEEQRRVREEKPPADFSIVEAEYRGKVIGEIARFDSDYKIRVFKEGWVLIPFFSNDVGLEEVEIKADKPSFTVQPDVSGPESLTVEDGNEAQFVRDRKGYSLLARGPASISVNVVFNLPIKNENLVDTVKFFPPRSVINRIELTIREKGVRLINTAPAGRVVQKDDEAVFMTALSERDTLEVSWRVEKDEGIVRKKQAVCHSLASMDKSAVSVLSKITLKHVDSLKSLEFRLPMNVEIVNVTSPDIDRWQVEHREAAQVIKIDGKSDRHQFLEISFTYLLRINSLPAELKIPVIGVYDVDMLEGFLGVEVLGNLDVSTGEIKKGVIIPAKNLPAQIWDDASSPLLYGYEFHLNDFSPSLAVKSYHEIQTVVANVDLVDCVTHRTLAGKSVTRVRYFIRNNDRQFLTLTLPEKSRIWQAFLDGKPVKPAQNDAGKILIPMIKSVSQGDELRSFLIEIGYITDVEKLSLKGDIINELPLTDIPVNYLRWSLYLPEYYGYSKFEGPLKRVEQFSADTQDIPKSNPMINIPLKGARFLFEKYLIVDELPYIKGKYGQYLGMDNFLSISPRRWGDSTYGGQKTKDSERQQVVPNLY